MDDNISQNNQPPTDVPLSSYVAPSSPMAEQQVEMPAQEVVEVAPPVVPPPQAGNRLTGGLLKKILFGIVAIIILVLVVLFITSKGNGDKKVKLVWWGLWEDSRVMQPIISDFQRIHPNITIEYIQQDAKQYREKLIARTKNGTGPDIYRYHNTWVPMISDILLPLPTDVISPTEFKKIFYPVMQKDLILNGGIYGIPLGADSLSLFINSDIFKSAGVQVPKTWNEFIDVSGKLTVKDSDTRRIKTAGAAMGTYGNITHAPDIVSLLFLQQGVDLNKFSTQAENEAVALDFYTSFAKGNENVWDNTLDESLLSFARGSLAMYIGFSWDIFRIQGLSRDLPFQIYPVPQLVGQNTNIASYWVDGVSAKSLNKKQALLFMQFLTKKETAQKIYTTASKTRAFGEPYARRDLAGSLKDNKLIYPFLSQLESASSSFFASDTYDGDGGINSLSNSYLGSAIDSIVNDGSSTQTAVEALDKGITQVSQRYGL